MHVYEKVALDVSRIKRCVIRLNDNHREKGETLLIEFMSNGATSNSDSYIKPLSKLRTRLFRARLCFKMGDVQRPTAA